MFQLIRLRQYVVQKSKNLALSKRFQLPEKWKGGRIERWGEFWQALFADYKTVATDVITEARTRPQKAVVITSGLGLMFGAFRSNPDLQSFQDYTTDCTNDMMLISSAIRNPVSESHIKFLTSCKNQGLMRQLNLLFFTFIWIDDHHPDCNVYAAQCSYLKPKYLTFYERIIDVGVYGQWLNLRWKMKDFDINPEEWKNSSR